MYPSRDIYILGIHEEALVEQALLPQGVASEKEEATQQIRHIEGPVMIGIGQKIPLHAASRETPGQETLGKEIVRRRQHSACVLQVAVRISHLGHHQPDIRIVIHVGLQSGKDITLPADVGVHDQMVFQIPRQRLADGYVMPGAEPSVFHMTVLRTEFPGHTTQRIVVGIVDHPDCIHDT